MAHPKPHPSAALRGMHGARVSTHTRDNRFSFNQPSEDFVRFDGEIPSGKGERTITISIPIVDILQWAKIYKTAAHTGHATWHLQNPDHPLPCSTCEGRK